MRIIIHAVLVVLLLSGPGLAADAPVSQDYKQLYFQEQAMRGGLLIELGRLLQENAILKQRVDALETELQAQKKETEKTK